MPDTKPTKTNTLFWALSWEADKGNDSKIILHFPWGGKCHFPTDFHHDHSKYKYIYKYKWSILDSTRNIKAKWPENIIFSVQCENQKQHSTLQTIIQPKLLTTQEFSVRDATNGADWVQFWPPYCAVWHSLYDFFFAILIIELLMCYNINCRTHISLTSHHRTCRIRMQTCHPLYKGTASEERWLKFKTPISV